MTTSPPPDLLTTSPPDPDRTDGPDVPRRTWLAAERTWLAWWRTGLGAAALAIAVGRVLPGLTGGTRWPYVVLGLGYGVLAVAVLVVGAVRQQRVAKALHRDGYDELSSPLVMWLTAAAIALSTITLTVIVVSV
jgi:uncharacterized membrane protein YidH (DUF202 family)